MSFLKKKKNIAEKIHFFGNALPKSNARALLKQRRKFIFLRKTNVIQITQGIIHLVQSRLDVRLNRIQVI